MKRPQTDGGKYENNGKCHCREEIKRNLWDIPWQLYAECEDDLDELDQPKKCKMGILLDGCICEERKSQRTKQKAGGGSRRVQKILMGSELGVTAQGAGFVTRGVTQLELVPYK